MSVQVRLINPDVPASKQLSAEEIVRMSFGTTHIEQAVVDYVDDDGAGIYVALLLVGSQRFVDKDGDVPVIPIVLTPELVGALIAGLQDTLQRIASNDYRGWEKSSE